MHKYYYKDDNQYFVLDDTNKLYKYTCKNNIEFILNYENALEILEQDLHTDGISKIMAYDELPYKMQYALNQIATMGLVGEIALIPNLPFSFAALQTVFLISLKNYLLSYKEKNKEVDSLYNASILETCNCLKEKLASFQNFSPYTKEEVPLSYLNPDLPKTYLPEKAADKYYKFIDLEVLVNTSTSEVIKDLNNLDSEEKILVENLVEQYPFESIKNRMKYCRLKENRNDCYGYQTTFSLFIAMFMLASDILPTNINFNIPALIALANVIRLHLKNQKITHQLNNQENVRLTLNKKDII